MVENLEISAMSYVNKDFGSMYPEILNIAKQLTNEWDPATSNESDPGVVLLKEAAFVADHNNYNIDKNILENFLPSATQDISVRNITEMNGYTPRYYVSATGNVSFNWTKPESESDYPSSFTIPSFTLVVSDENETVSYTQIEPLVVNDLGPVSCKFIEGTLQTLNINNSNVITLEDLDDNNRVYFPEAMVAQNGVYVRNYNSTEENYFVNEDDYWTRDNYLLTRPNGTKVYKIDYDSILGLPYVEFPSDISSLIGDGIIVEYISTSGLSGNISANTLTKILSPSDFYAIGENVSRTTESFAVFNAGSIANGKNPETIEEMYRSFKKVVGTFDTLVTCKDYSNKIYTLTDGYDNPLVSNAYVTDRRTDYNKSINIMSYDVNLNALGFENLSIQPCSLTWKGVYKITKNSKGEDITLNDEGSSSSESAGAMYFVYRDDNINGGSLYINMTTTSGRDYREIKTINLNDFALLSEAMSPYDLVIYALKAFSMSEYTSVVPEYALDNSFIPVTGGILRTIKNGLEENKCINHTYVDSTGKEVFIFKNYAPLKVEIEPYNKVKTVEEYQIINNIYKAISEKFNPRNLEFGEKINEETLRKVIIEADSRIKSIKLYPLEYETHVMYSDTERYNDLEPSLIDKSSGVSTLLVDLIAKNVLEGRVCLFNFNNNFKFDYGQQGIKDSSGNYVSIIKDKKYIKSEALIKLNENADDTINIQNIDRINSTYTFKQDGDVYNYKYIFRLGTQIDNFSIASKTTYTMATNDQFEIYYKTDSGYINKVVFKNDNSVFYTITNNTNDRIIPNIDKDDDDQHVLAGGGKVIVSANYINQSTADEQINLDYYTLNPNEIIQILSPNYTSDMVFSMYVYYKYINSNPNGAIYANTDHTLQTGEEIILLYSIDGKEQQKILESGTIVNANFNIYPTDQLVSNVSKKEWRDSSGDIHEDNFKQLTSNQTISTRKLMETQLDNSTIWCYWILDKANRGNENNLFPNRSKETILGNNEYFIYTNASLNELIILGAGTKLMKSPGPDSTDSWWVIKDDQNISIESIAEYGTSMASASIPWVKNIDFSSYPLYIQEMSVITLGAEDQIMIAGWDGQDIPDRSDVDDPDLKTKKYLNSDWIYCNGTISYKVKGTEDFVQLPKIDKHYQIRSRLDLNMSNEYPQQLYAQRRGNTEIVSIQRITFGSGDGKIVAQPKITITKDPEDPEQKKEIINIDEVYVQSSEPIAKIGGSIELSSNENINFYQYTKEKDKDNNIRMYTKSIQIPYNTTTGDGQSGSDSYSFYYDSNCGTPNGDFLIPIHIFNDEVKVILNAKDENGGIINLVDFNAPELQKESGGYVLLGNTSYYISIVDSEGNPLVGSKNITLTFSWGKSTGRRQNEVINLENPIAKDGFNKEIKPQSVLGEVLKRMKAIVAGSDKPSIKYYYPYKSDNSVIMDNTDFEDANAMWDINNIANKMTLPKIDIKNSSIKVIASMKRD